MPTLPPKPERIRSPRHLARLRTLACCIPDCWRQPVDPHHLNWSQPKGKGLRASDSKTVPLCRWTHHSATSAEGVHSVGDEAAWWRAHGIDPLAVANDLWAETNEKQSRSAA